VLGAESADGLIKAGGSVKDLVVAAAVFHEPMA
jgi:hypothetical protein